MGSLYQKHILKYEKIEVFYTYISIFYMSMKKVHGKPIYFIIPCKQEKNMSHVNSYFSTQFYLFT
jgi:hypothetical protein